MSVSDIIASMSTGYTGGFQQKFVYDGSDRVEYLGIAQCGHTTAQAAWWVFKFSYDVAGNVDTVKMAPKRSIMDNYSSLTYA